MLIVDQLFLIGIDEKSKKFILKWDDYLLYGALIMDLILKNKISVSERNLKIEVINYNSTNDVLLDKMLDLIKTSKGDKTLIDLCILFLKKSNKSEFRDSLISRLENSNLIKYLGKKMLKRRYTIIKPEIKREISNEIHAVLIDNNNPTKELIFLLSLLNIESNFLRIIPKKLKELAEKRIKKLVKQEHIGKTIQEYIEELKEQAQEALDDLLDDD